MRCCSRIYRLFLLMRYIMDGKVVFRTFSGDKLVSTRETTVNDYYNEENPEIDDWDWIRENSIDRVEFTLDCGGDHKEYKNFYDEQGRLCRCELNENGEYFEEDIFYDADGRLITK